MKHPDEQNSAILPGLKPVLELLERDPSRIDSLILKKGLRTRETDRMLDICRTHGIRFSLVENPALDRLCPPHKDSQHRTAHQGVIARLTHTAFTETHILLENTPSAPLPLLLAFDQIQDAGNTGTLARTLCALGGGGIILPKHNSAYLGAAASRSAAGALERLPVSRVPNLGHALDAAEEAGYTIYGAAATPQSHDAYTEEWQFPAVLVLGNENKGLRPGIMKRCSRIVRIPMPGGFDSLNVAQAGAILMGLCARYQQQNTKS